MTDKNFYFFRGGFPHYVTFIFFFFFTVSAAEKTTLPFIDNVKTRWSASGSSAWMLTGMTDLKKKITATDISADGQFLGIGTDDGEVILFNLAEQKVEWTTRVIPGRAAVKILKISPDASHILTAKQLGVNEGSHLYMLAADGTVTDMGMQAAFNPACSRTNMDPAEIAWSADGTTFYILYKTHALANFDSCHVAAEYYVFANNLEKGNSAVQNIIIEAFSEPEDDEPDKIWCSKMVRLTAIGNDGFATSSCNSRIIKWNFKGKKITKVSKSKNIQLTLARQGHDTVGGSGYMTVDKKGGIYYGMGEPGAMAKSAIVYLDSNLKKMELKVQVHAPYPYPRLNEKENYLFIGAEPSFLYNQQTRQLLYYGPLGRAEGHLAQLHPQKKIIVMVSNTGLYYLVERPAKMVQLNTQWLKTGILVKKKDSVDIQGKGRLGYGTGNWLREDFKYDGFWINNAIGGGIMEDVTEEGELSLRLKEGSGKFVIYGGRSKKEISEKLLLNNQPGW